MADNTSRSQIAPESGGYNPLAMAVFSTNEVIDQRLDWTVLRDGGVALYWRPEILADDLHWFGSNGYRIVSFETADWLTEDQMHDSLNADLSFPDYYGKNLNALDECMWDDLVVPDAGGLVLVLNHYDHFAKAGLDAGSSGKKTADVVLDIFARAIRYHMLFGKRLIILVQSDDPWIRFDGLGGASAIWNRREWLNKNRGV
jgi:RNAse (barnase) inhibitor barstar